MNKRGALRRPARGAAVVAALVALNACASGGGANRAGATARESASFSPSAPLHGNELTYGAGFGRSTTITFQPDVVFLDGGASSIKAVSADGMSWTVSGRAANIAALQPGKIMVATSYGVGRILAVTDSGGDKTVALGPVALTDIVKDGTLSSAEPIPLTGFYAYDVSGRPGLVTPTTASTSSAGAVTLPTARFMAYTDTPARRALMPMLRPAVDLPVPTSTAHDSSIGDFQVQTVCCTSIGLHIGYDKHGGRVAATVGFNMDRPSVGFSIAIGGGKLIKATVTLHGAAALKFDVSAATLNEAGNFRGPRVQVPVDIQIPIVAGPIPMTVGVQQIFSMGIALSGRAAFSATGEYKVGGSLGFSVDTGGPHVETPTLTTQKSLIDTMRTLSVGPSGLDLAYALKVSVGVGTLGFTAGAWYQLSAGLGLTSSGTPGTALVTCKHADLSLTGRYGVGYSIPELVTKLVNTFLSAIYSRATPIQSSGGPQWGPTTLFSKATPPCSK